MVSARAQEDLMLKERWMFCQEGYEERWGQVFRMKDATSLKDRSKLYEQRPPGVSADAAANLAYDTTVFGDSMLDLLSITPANCADST